MNDTLAKIRALTEAFEAEKAKLYESLRPAFGQAFQEYLVKYPFVHGVQFTAYTPYFNDGEECTYGVNELEAIDSEGEPMDLYQYGPTIDEIIAYQNGEITQGLKNRLTYYVEPRMGYPRYYSSQPPYASYEDAVKGVYPHIANMDTSKFEDYERAHDDLQELQDSLDEEFIENLFGDHVRVTITREGLDADEYSHD